MLRLLAWIIKGAIFTAIVLILGNWIRIGNKTISDQVKTEMAHAEKSEFAGKVRDWAERVSDDAREGRKKIGLLRRAGREEGTRELIPSSERQKLKALMKELGAN